MPRTTPSEELQLIESIVAAHPNGARISAIEAEMGRKKGVQHLSFGWQAALQSIKF